MASGDLTILFVSLGVGIPVFVVAILLLVFTLVRGAIARARVALDHEGIVLDSGPIWITVRYSNFRAPGVYRGVGLDKSRGSLVLTRQRLVLSPNYTRRRYHSVAYGDLGRYTVGMAPDGSLHLHSDEPPNASGSIDYRVPVGDAAGWVRTLTQLGARAAHT